MPITSSSRIVLEDSVYNIHESLLADPCHKQDYYLACGDFCRLVDLHTNSLFTDDARAVHDLYCRRYSHFLFIYKRHECVKVKLIGIELRPAAIM